jgi:hypothetical protein
MFTAKGPSCCKSLEQEFFIIPYIFQCSNYPYGLEYFDVDRFMQTLAAVTIPKLLQVQKRAPPYYSGIKYCASLLLQNFP